MAQVEEMEARLRALRANAPPDSSEVRELKSENEDLKQRLKRSLQSTQAAEQLLQTQTDKLLQALPKSLAVSGENYVDMNRVFGAAGLNGETSEIFDAYVTPAREKPDCDCVLKTRTCTYLPYASEQVEQALWRRMQSETAILPRNVQSCEDLVRRFWAGGALERLLTLVVHLGRVFLLDWRQS
jgi:regulator of replication initiation timing